MQRIVLAVLCVGLCALASAQMMAPWGQFGHDMMHTGRSNYTGPKGALPNLKFATNLSYSTIESSPVIDSNGVVYIGSDSNMVYAVNGRNGGGFLWNFTTDEDVSSSPALGMNGMLYVTCQNGVLYAINASTGASMWNFTASSSTIYSSPVVGPDGMVYYGSEDNTVYALNGMTGAQMWNFTADDSIRTTPALYNGMLFFGTDTYTANFYAVNATTGMGIWNMTIGQYFEYASPVVDNGMVYAGDYYGHIYCWNSRTGAPVWNFTSSSGVVYGLAIGSDGTLYASVGYYLYALNGATGAMSWNYTASFSSLAQPIVGADGTVYVGSHDNNIYAVYMGAKVWSYATRSTVYGNAAIDVDGTLYIGSGDGGLYAFSAVVVTAAPTSGPTPIPTLAPSPTPVPYTAWSMYGHDMMHTGRSSYQGPSITVGTKWRFIAGSTIAQSAVVGADGTIYIGSYDRRVYALNPTTGAQKWNFTCGDYAAGPLVGPDGTVYFGSDDGQFRAVNGQTGALIWNNTNSTEYIRSSPVLNAEGTVIYFGSQDNHVYALNITTGVALWSFTTSYNVDFAPAVGPDGTIYANSGSYMYGIWPNGTQRWRTYTTSSSCSSAPSVAEDGTVYIGCDNGVVYALGGLTGGIRWNFTTGSYYVRTTVAISSTGTIYFGDYNGRFYGVNGQTGASVFNVSIYPYNYYYSIYSSPVIGSDGTVYFTGTNSRLFAVSATNGAFSLNVTIASSSVGLSMGPTGDIYIPSGSYLYCASSSFGPTPSPVPVPTPSPAPTPAPGCGTYSNCFDCTYYSYSTCNWCSTSSSCVSWSSSCANPLMHVWDCPNPDAGNLTAGNVTLTMSTFGSYVTAYWSGFGGNIWKYGVALATSTPNGPSFISAYLVSTFYSSYVLGSMLSQGTTYIVYVAAFSNNYTNEVIASATFTTPSTCNATNCFDCTIDDNCVWCESTNHCGSYSDYCSGEDDYHPTDCPVMPAGSLTAGSVTATYSSATDSVVVTWSGFSGPIAKYGAAIGYFYPESRHPFSFMQASYVSTGAMMYTFNNIYASPGSSLLVYVAAWDDGFAHQVVANATVNVPGICNATDCFDCSLSAGCFWCGSSNMCMDGTSYWMPSNSMCTNMSSMAFNPVMCALLPRGNLTAGTAMITQITNESIAVSWSGFTGNVWKYGLAVEMAFPYDPQPTYVTATFVPSTTNMYNFSLYYVVPGVQYVVYVAALGNNYADEAYTYALTMLPAMCNYSDCFACTMSPNCGWCATSMKCLGYYDLAMNCSMNDVVGRATSCPALPPGTLMAGNVTLIAITSYSISVMWSGFSGATIGNYSVSVQMMDPYGRMRDVVSEFENTTTALTATLFGQFTSGVTYYITVTAFDTTFTHQVSARTTAMIPNYCSYSNCYQCSMQVGCGWCISSQTCTNGGVFGPAAGTCTLGWTYSSGMCPATAMGNLTMGSVSIPVMNNSHVMANWRGFMGPVGMYIVSLMTADMTAMVLGTATVDATMMNYTFHDLELRYGMSYKVMVTAATVDYRYRVSASATSSVAPMCNLTNANCYNCAYQSGCGWCTSSMMCSIGTAAGPAMASSCAATNWKYDVSTCPVPPAGTLTAGTVTVLYISSSAFSFSWMGYGGGTIYEYGFTLMAMDPASGVSAPVTSGFTRGALNVYTFTNLMLSPGVTYTIYVAAFDVNYMHSATASAWAMLSKSVVPIMTSGNTTITFTNPNSTAGAAASTATNSMINIPAGAVPPGAVASMQLVSMSDFTSPTSGFANPYNYTSMNYAGVSFSLSITYNNTGFSSLMAPITVTVSVSNPNGDPMLYLYSTSAMMWQDAAATCPQRYSMYDGSTGLLTVNICHLTQFAVFSSPSSSKNEAYKWIIPVVIILVLLAAGAAFGIYKYMANKKAKAANAEGETYYTQLLPTSGNTDSHL